MIWPCGEDGEEKNAKRAYVGECTGSCSVGSLKEEVD